MSCKRNEFLQIVEKTVNASDESNPNKRNSLVDYNWNETVENFDDMKLREELLRGIYGYGFDKPSAIQQKAIIPCIKGNDVIVQAQSGTGKTALYLIAILQKLDLTLKECQVLVLAPGRELAQAIKTVAAALGDFMEATCHACIGGTSIKEEISKLEQGVQIVVGTPGRVSDMITRKALNVRSIKMFVLDEADEMLSRGFKEQIHEVFTKMPYEIQVILLSSTMPAEVLEVTTMFMRKLIQIIYRESEKTLEGIRQYYINAGKDEFKFEKLYELYTMLHATQAIIFCNKKSTVNLLIQQMRSKELIFSALHADIGFIERNIVIQEFKRGISRILITTDILNHSIFLQISPLVINYELPSSPEIYAERIRRGGFFGQKGLGLAINVITDDLHSAIHDLEKYYHTEIKQMPTDIRDII